MALDLGNSSAAQPEDTSAFEETTPSGGETPTTPETPSDEPVVDVSDPGSPAPEDGGVGADVPPGAGDDDTIDADPSAGDAGVNDPSVLDSLFNGTGNENGSPKGGKDEVGEQEISGKADIEDAPEPTKPQIDVPQPTEPPTTEPVIDIPTDPPTEPAPTEPAPTEPAPTEPAPTEPAPTEPASTEPAPTEPAPTEPAPTEPAPKEHAPKEHAPTEPAPTEPATEPETEPIDLSDDPVIVPDDPIPMKHRALSDAGNERKYDFFQTCMNVLAYKFHFPVKNLVLACGGEDLLNELEEGGYHVPVYGDELMDDYLHDSHEQSVFTNALKMVFGDENATDADRDIAEDALRDQAEDVADGIAASGDLDGDGKIDEKDAAITQSEWGVDANSAAPMTEEDTGIQTDLKNSQWDQYDSGNYNDVLDSGNGLSDNASAQSGAAYYDGDAGSEHGGIEGNNGYVSTGTDGNPDYDRAPNDKSLEDAGISGLTDGVEASHVEADDMENTSDSATLDSLQAQIDELQKELQSVNEKASDISDFISSYTTSESDVDVAKSSVESKTSDKTDDWYNGADLPGYMPESAKTAVINARNAQRNEQYAADALSDIQTPDASDYEAGLDA